jgi:ABC-2 type transport system permease protein
MTANTSSPNSLFAESLLFAGRHVRHWRKLPAIPIQTVVLPTLLLIVYYTLVGKSMRTISGTDNLDGLVPVCALAGAMFGALGAGFNVPFERACGLLSRWWVSPVHRASVLVGRLIAEAGRTVLSTALITAVGVGLGLRFDGGWITVIPFLLVPVMVVVVFTTVILTFAVSAGPNVNTLFTYLATGSVGLVFASSGVAPLAMYPAWVQPLIQYQPMSPAIESMRAFVEGRSAVWPLTLTFAWVLAFAAVFGPLAIRRYRLAAESGW